MNYTRSSSISTLTPWRDMTNPGPRPLAPPARAHREAQPRLPILLQPTEDAITDDRRPPSPIREKVRLQMTSAIRTTETTLVEGGGFEPPKAEPSDLQSDPFGHSGTPPKRKPRIVIGGGTPVNSRKAIFP